jgi:hypothetical protein
VELLRLALGTRAMALTAASAPSRCRVVRVQRSMRLADLNGAEVMWR